VLKLRDSRVKELIYGQSRRSVIKRSKIRTHPHVK